MSSYKELNLYVLVYWRDSFRIVKFHQWQRQLYYLPVFQTVYWIYSSGYLKLSDIRADNNFSRRQLKGSERSRYVDDLLVK